MRNLLCSVLAFATLAACDDRHVAYNRSREVLGPIPLKDRIAYIDSARDRVVVVDIAGQTPQVSVKAIGRNARRAEPTPDLDHLVVLTGGEEAIELGQIDEEPAMWFVDVADPSVAPVRYALDSPFDRIAVADDNRVAVAYFSEGGPDGSGFFRNPNELAIIDLATEPGENNPVMKTVRSFGSAPTGIVLSPPMVVPGSPDSGPRTFAFVFAPGTLTIVDTTHPERREITIRLDGTGSNVVPRELAFAATTATAYLRSDNARDILEILISYEAPNPDEADDNDYRVALAELGAGGGPSDIAVFDDDSGRRTIIATTPTTGEVVLIDAETAQFTTVSVGDPVDRILLFPEGDGLTPTTALLASLGTASSRMHLLGLTDIADELVPAELTTVTTEQPVLDVQAVPNRELAMIVHDDNRTVLGLLDIAIGSVSPLEGVGRLDSYTFTPQGSHLIGATSGVDRVGFLDLDNLHPTDLRLDAPAGRVIATPSGAVFIDHGASFGLATIAPHAGATRSESLVLSGFLLHGLLDEEF